MQQLLRLLMLLAGNKRYTLHELQKRFDVSERTIYRYLDTIEEAGFVVNRMNFIRKKYKFPQYRVFNNPHMKRV